MSGRNHWKKLACKRLELINTSKSPGFSKPGLFFVAALRPCPPLSDPHSVRRPDVHQNYGSPYFCPGLAAVTIPSQLSCSAADSRLQGGCMASSPPRKGVGPGSEVRPLAQMSGLIGSFRMWCYKRPQFATFRLFFTIMGRTLDRTFGPQSPFERRFGRCPVFGLKTAQVPDFRVFRHPSRYFGINVQTGHLGR